MKVICIGEALIDFVCTQTDHETQRQKVYIKKPGGAPANVAACIAHLDGHAEFVGALGNDHFGQFIIDTLESYQVGTRFVQRVDVPTTLAFVTLQDDGEREFTFNRGADAEYALAAADTDSLTDQAICHYGSATAFLEGTLQHSYMKFAKIVKERGAFFSFDPNYRPDLWAGRVNEFRGHCETMLAMADMVKVSEEELFMLTQTQNLATGCDGLHAMGASYIFVTLGSRGCLLSINGEREVVPAPKIVAVDTTGAGDAFVGAMLYKIAAGQPAKSLSFEDWKLYTAFAVQVSALVCTQIGAMSALSAIEKPSSAQSSRLGTS